MFRTVWTKFRALPVAAQVIAWVLVGGFLLGVTGVLRPPPSPTNYPTSPPTYGTPAYATPAYATPTYSPPTFDAPIYPTGEAPATTDGSAPVYVNPPNLGDGHDHHPIRHQVCKHTIFC